MEVEGRSDRGGGMPAKRRKRRSSRPGTGAGRGFDSEAIARAEAVVAAFADDYLEAAKQDVAELEAFLRGLEGEAASWPDTGRRMMSVCHRMSGQGGSFGFPLVTRLARSLYEFLSACTEAEAGLKEANLLRAHRHVALLHRVVESGIRGKGDAKLRRAIEEVEYVADRDDG